MEILRYAFPQKEIDIIPTIIIIGIIIIVVILYIMYYLKKYR